MRHRLERDHLVGKQLELRRYIKCKPASAMLRRKASTLCAFPSAVAELRMRLRGIADCCAHCWRPAVAPASMRTKSRRLIGLRPKAQNKH